MRIGFIDCDRKNKRNEFPNLPLMKLSTFHKQRGDSVEWYQTFNGHYDKVYVSKVFSFSPDYPYFIDADQIVKGGSGFAIRNEAGREIYDKSKDEPLPQEIEHLMPDYELYGITDTAYGFLSRGCPRGCDFCHIKEMQGQVSRKVANLEEFWNGQKKIVLLDANISACRDWRELFQQLEESKAWIDFSQGLDIRLMTDEKILALMRLKIEYVHFAWDRYEDKELILPKIKHFAELTQWSRKKIVVYVLVGDRERKITEQDLERIYLLREIALPYVMIYDSQNLPRGHELKRLQRWVNNRFVWESTPTFEEYQKKQETESDQLKLF